MVEGFSENVKVHLSETQGYLSILDMLNFFHEKGAMRVSDLHIKVDAQPTYRIDGTLVKLKGSKVTHKTAEQLIYPLLSDESLAKFKKNHSVDCSYKLRSLQFRINVFLENDGICAAIRALSMDILKIEDIGFPNDVWQDIVNQKHGLVLITGITGAGKSTTIASLIDRISEKHACRIITMEDPIEYIYQQRSCIISQREVGRDIPSFTSGLRDMMRQDPDIIFVGEMRDAETIAMTLTAAETGHLVFSTLHTRDAVGSITRLLDYFPPQHQAEVRNQLSLGLAYVISQKLIPKKDGTGRIVAMEILRNNHACANLIRTGKLEQIYSQIQIAGPKSGEKMITMESHLAKLVKEEKIELFEAQKWANNISSFTNTLKHDYR